MKKTIIALLALLAAAALAGCGKTETPPSETTAETTAATSAPASTTEETTAPESTDESKENSELSEKELETEKWVNENKIVLDEVPKFEQNGLKILTAEDALANAPYETTFLPKYRDIYYWGPSFLYDIVDQNDFAEWYETVVRADYKNNAEPKEMYTVSFVKYFKIPKKVFERCCEQKKEYLEFRRDEYGYDINVEGAEIPNADIIYTFDNEIINNYYLRDQEGIVYTKPEA